MKKGIRYMIRKRHLRKKLTKKLLKYVKRIGVVSSLSS